MSDGDGRCRRRHVWAANAGGCLMLLVIAFLLVAAPWPAATTGQDVLHEEIGIDYDNLIAGVQAAYAQARSHTLEAARILFPDDGDEYAPDAMETAMALYEASLAIVRETEARYRQAYEKIPLLFVQLDYLAVKNLSGMAAILSLRGELDAAHQMRTTLIQMAEEDRSRIAVAIERKILPQFQDQYLEIDDSFRQLLTESYVWMGVDAEAAGNAGEARAHYVTALELSDSPDGQDAIHVLLERLKFMHGRAVLTAGGKQAVPTVADPGAEDDLPATPADPAVENGQPSAPPTAGEPAAVPVEIDADD